MIELLQFYNELPESEKLKECVTDRVKVQLGNGTKNLHTIKTYERVPDQDELEHFLTESGLGTEHEYAKITAIGPGTVYILSKSLIRHLTADSSLTTEKTLSEQNSMLVHQLLRQSEKQSEWAFRVIDRQSQQVETLVKQNNRLRSDVFEAEASTMALDMELQNAEAQQTADTKTQALEALVEGIQVMKQAQARNNGKGKITKDQAKDLLVSSPGLVKELVQDEDLVNMFMAEILTEEAENAETE